MSKNVTKIPQIRKMVVVSSMVGVESVAPRCPSHIPQYSEESSRKYMQIMTKRQQINYQWRPDTQAIKHSGIHIHVVNKIR